MPFAAAMIVLALQGTVRLEGDERNERALQQVVQLERELRDLKTDLGTRRPALNGRLLAALSEDAIKLTAHLERMDPNGNVGAAPAVVQVRLDQDDQNNEDNEAGGEMDVEDTTNLKTNAVARVEFDTELARGANRASPNVAAQAHAQTIKLAATLAARKSQTFPWGPGAWLVAYFTIMNNADTYHQAYHKDIVRASAFSEDWVPMKGMKGCQYAHMTAESFGRTSCHDISKVVFFAYTGVTGTTDKETDVQINVKDLTLEQSWRTAADALAPNKVIRMQATCVSCNGGCLTDHYMTFACDANSRCRTLQAYQGQLDLASFVATLLNVDDSDNGGPGLVAGTDSQKVPLKVIQETPDLLCAGTNLNKDTHCLTAKTRSAFPCGANTPDAKKQTADLSAWGYGMPLTDLQNDFMALGSDAFARGTSGSQYVEKWIRLAGKPPSSNVVADYNGEVTNPYHVKLLLQADLDDGPASIAKRFAQIVTSADTVNTACCGLKGFDPCS